MRFLIIDALYPAFLENFYSRHPDYGKLCYKDAWRLSMDESVGIADGYSRGLNNLGHEAEEVILNDKLLQLRWAFENDLNIAGERSFHNLMKDTCKRICGKKLYGLLKNITPGCLKVSACDPWMLQVLAAQIRKIRPDVLLVHTIKEVDSNFLKEMRPYVKFIVGQHSSLLPPNLDYSAYDLMISCAPILVDFFRSQGLKSEYLRLGFNDSVLNRLRKSKDRFNVVHIGGYGTVHNERNSFLEQVVENADVDFWGFGTDNLLGDSRILKSYHGEAWGVNRLNIFYNSKIVITKHITQVAGEFSGNMTLYEATGVGSFLLADKKRTTEDLFEVGKEVVVYENHQECIEAIKYYLEHEDERQAIASAGQKRTLKEYTYNQRMRELVKILERCLWQ